MKGTTAELEKILSIINKVIRGPWRVDKENLATGIWIELWTLNKDISFIVVKNKCIDELRKVIRLKEVEIGDDLKDTLKDPKTPDVDNNIDVKELVNDLMSGSKLSDLERIVIFRKFYLGLNATEIGIDLGRSKSWANKILAQGIKKIRAWIREQTTRSTATKL